MVAGGGISGKKASRCLRRVFSSSGGLTARGLGRGERGGDGGQNWGGLAAGGWPDGGRPRWKSPAEKRARGLTGEKREKEEEKRENEGGGGLRQRLKPPLPNEYFGMRFKQGLLSSPLQRAENFVKSPTFPYPTDIVQTRSTPVLLIAGSSHRFNVYGNDFGWGRPLCVRDGPAGKKNGMLKVYPGDEEGKIDFSVCLLHETLQAMAGDAEFMDALLQLY
ncbi:hypothetical protein ACLB2K_001338 [Fragaria x ananassa]